MPRKLIHHPPAVDVPHEHVRARAPRADARPVRAPRAPQKRFFKVVRVTREVLDAPVSRRVRLDVPHPQRAVHRVREDVRPVRARRDPGDRVRVPRKRQIRRVFFPNVVRSQHVVDAAGVDLAGILGEGHRRDLEPVRERPHRVLPPQVPQLRGAVVAAGDHERVAAGGRRARVDERLVPAHVFDAEGRSIQSDGGVEFIGISWS